MKILTYNEAIEAKDELGKLLRDRGTEISAIGVAKDPDNNGYAIKINLPSSTKSVADIQSLLPDIKVIVEVVGRIRFLGSY